MKKLTATIFATLLTVVSVNAANAEIASKGYVDEEVGKVNTALEGKVDDSEITDMLTKTEASSTYETKTNASSTYATKTALSDGLAAKADTTALTAKQDVSKKVTDATVGDHAGSDDMYTSVSAAEKIAQDAVDGVTGNISGLTERVTTAEGEIDTLQTGKADKATSLAGYGITDAYTKGESDGRYATAAQGALADTALQKSGTLTQGNLLTTDATGKIIDAGKKGALAAKDTVAADDIAANAVTTAKILDGNVTKAKLATEVQASLGKADTALQADAIADMLTKTEATSTYATKTELAGKADKSALTAKQDVTNLVKSAGFEGAKTDDTKYPSVKAVADAITKATDDIASEEVVSALGERVTTAEGEIDTLQSDVSANKTAIGTVGSLTTEEKNNLVGAINEVDKNADVAQSTADQAKAKADKAIPAPTSECTNLGAKCVLVVGNDGYAWEVIQRGTSEGGQP